MTYISFIRTNIPSILGENQRSSSARKKALHQNSIFVARFCSAQRSPKRLHVGVRVSPLIGVGGILLVRSSSSSLIFIIIICLLTNYLVSRGGFSTLGRFLQVGCTLRPAVFHETCRFARFDIAATFSRLGPTLARFYTAFSGFGGTAARSR